MNDPLVSTIMTPWLEVLRPQAKLSEARRMLLDGLRHHLPVVSAEGVLLGLLSSTDMLRLSFDAYEVTGQTMDAVIDAQFSLKEIMRTNLVTIRENETVKRAAELLSSGTFHALPVVDDDDHVLGIVTSTDLIAFLIRELS
jgi:CBS domain-containing protein